MKETFSHTKILFLMWGKHISSVTVMPLEGTSKSLTTTMQRANIYQLKKVLWKCPGECRSHNFLFWLSWDQELTRLSQPPCTFWLWLAFGCIPSTWILIISTTNKPKVSSLAKWHIHKESWKLNRIFGNSLFRYSWILSVVEAWSFKSNTEAKYKF